MSNFDILLNYIRYWQASGESIKTSFRVKAGIAQIVGAGHFAGGKAPFGYRLVKSGRFNTKKGAEVLDYALDDEATLNRVKEIFSKYVNEGYGNSRLVQYLYEQGVVKPNGKPFSPLNISRMIQNELYNGYVKRGETRTFVPALQIIDDDTFSRVQELRKMRNKSNHDRRRVPMNTKGAGLLSGNAFCGHCGRRMGFANSTTKHRNQNGEVTSYNSPGYVCGYGAGLGGSTCQHKYVSTKTLGINVHSYLAVTTEGLVLGILDQSSYTREIRKDETASHDQKKWRSIEEKESYRWLRTMENSSRDLPGGIKVIHVCDREGDMYELFEKAVVTDKSFLIRIIQNRPTLDSGRLIDSVKKLEPAGSVDIRIPRDSRRNIAPRNAILNISYQ